MNYLRNSNIPPTKAIRNLGNVLIFKLIILNKISSKLKKSKLFIYAGIYDGIQGSVPITHSINFYNKVLTDLFISDTSKYISVYEKLQLLEFRVPLGDYGQISGRDICLIKKFKNIKLTVFTGNHEMLPEYAFNELLTKF